MSRPSSSSGLPGPISQLPSEILSDIFSRLDDPLDVYRVSITARAWRAAAVDPRLWEDFYWRFYRCKGSDQGGQHEVFWQRREHRRRSAMREWIAKTSPSAAPSDLLRPFLVRHQTSGESTLYAPLARGILRFISTQGGSTEAVFNCMAAFMKRERAERGVVDVEDAASRLMEYLQQTLGTTPTAADDEYANVRVESFNREAAGRGPHSSPRSAALPPFLKSGIAGAPLPDFHALFTSRMNNDEQLVKDLRRHVDLSTGRLDDLLRLVDRHGDGARELLAALAADQKINEETVQVFLDGHERDDAARLHALDLHSRSAVGAAQPLPRSCIALYHAAQQLLGHLRRREAVRSMRKLRQRWKLGHQPERSVSTRRERILESCKGVEDALSDLALFRGGEKSEISAYLDLLALLVWAKLGAHGADTPARQMMSDIHSNLRTLGFGLANGEDFYHNGNSFINVVLCCPAQRQSIPLTYMAIVCAVARRLGVAATLINTPSVIMAVVVEDGEEPESWSGDDATKEWRRFFAWPGLPDDQFVVEVGVVKRFLSMQGGGAAQSDYLSSLLEPASPAVILERGARNLLNAGQERLPPSRARSGAADARRDGEDVSLPSPRDEFAALRDYLAGRQAAPPWPLSPALLRSSLSFLPPTQDLASRDNPYTARQDADYAAAWIFRAISPELLARGPDNWLLETFLDERVNDGPYQCDATLLLDINGCDVAHEMALARRKAQRAGEEGEQSGDDSSGEECSYSERPRAPAQLRNFLVRTLASDKLPCSGGSGGSTARDPAALRLSDESQPQQTRLRYAIGTVFHHRVHDYYGVVLGRESKCCASEGWIRQMRVDGLPSGGRNQPFYHVVVGDDESSRYVAQCNIEPVQIPADATEALGVLRELVPVFNLRAVGKSFRTAEIVATGGRAGEESGQGGGLEGGRAGEVRLVMNAWMREAWPHD